MLLMCTKNQTEIRSIFFFMAELLLRHFNVSWCQKGFCHKCSIRGVRRLGSRRVVRTWLMPTLTRPGVCGKSTRVCSMDRPAVFRPKNRRRITGGFAAHELQVSVRTNCPTSNSLSRPRVAFSVGFRLPFRSDRCRSFALLRLGTGFVLSSVTSSHG